MANKIQIKRSVTNTTVTGLANGELAYTANGTGVTGQGLLYIGDPGGSSPIVIGGKFNFGVLTACQAIVTNATSYTDKLLTANLTAANAFLTILYANGAVGSDAKVLQSNATGGIYWGSGATAGVSQVSTANGIAGGPITTTGTVYVNAAATSGLVANATGLWVQAANGLTINATGFIAVNSSPGISVNSTGTFVNLASTPGLNTSSGLTVYVGNGFTLNSTGLQLVPNTGITVNTSGIFGSASFVANSGIVSNATGVFVATGNGLAVVAGAGGNVYATAGNGCIVNTSGVCANIGGSLAFSTGALVVNAAATSSLVANATGLWVLVGNGHTVNSTGYIAVNASGSIAVNSTGVYANAGGSIVANATGIHVNAASTSGLVANTTGLWVAVNTSQLVVATGGITHNSSGNVTLQDLTLGGNLTVLGTMTVINTATLAVNDNLIEVAYNQAGTTTFTDAVDMGIYGAWGNTQASTNFYGGLARLRGSVGATPSNTNPYFVLFGANANPTDGTITTPVAAGNTGFLQSFLVPYGLGGAFVVNSTAMSFVANSTVSLNMTANGFTTGTLSLGTPLAVSNIAAGTDGQVLNMSGTTVQWSTLDGGTF